MRIKMLQNYRKHYLPSILNNTVISKTKKEQIDEKYDPINLKVLNMINSTKYMKRKK